MPAWQGGLLSTQVLASAKSEKHQCGCSRKGGDLGLQVARITTDPTWKARVCPHAPTQRRTARAARTEHAPASAQPQGFCAAANVAQPAHHTPPATTSTDTTPHSAVCIPMVIALRTMTKILLTATTATMASELYYTFDNKSNQHLCKQHATAKDDVSGERPDRRSEGSH